MKKLVSTLALVALIAPLNAFAALYGTLLGPTSTLVVIDESTGGVASTIGPIGYRVNGMVYDPTTDTMFATTSNGDASFPDGLISINLSTGAGTEIGTGAGQLVNVPAVNAAGDLYGWTEDSDELVLWNKAAGTVTVIPGSGLSSAEQSLVFDSGDTLYYVSVCCEGIQIINTATGAATPGPAITGNTGSTLHHGTVMPGTNLMYAITEVGGGGGGPRDIDIIDLSTGVVSSTLTSAPDNLHTLAFDSAPSVPSGPSAIPTLSFTAMSLLAGFLAIAGMIATRRRSA